MDNKKFNRRKNKENFDETKASAYSIPKQKPRPDKRYDPGKQNHLFAKLIDKYGNDFMGFADTKKEFNKYTLMGFLKTIYRGKFDFEKYGMYLADPRFLDKIIPLAESNSKQAFLHVCANQLLEYNPQFLANFNIPMNDFKDIVAVDKVKNEVWSIIYRAFMSVRCYNPCMNQGPPYTPVLISINDMNNIRCNRGFPGWNYIE